jgi:hypothetical protein
LILKAQAGHASEVARFGNEFCKLFQVLLVFVVKAVLDGAIHIDDGDNLDERQQSALLSSYNLTPLLPFLPRHHGRPKSRRRQKRKEEKRTSKLTFPSCKIGTTISEALAASQAMCPGNFTTSATS